jgi:hypothetical protein
MKNPHPATQWTLIVPILFIGLFSTDVAMAAVNVFLDFDAAWSLNLSQAATGAGAAPFDEAERTQIEATIVQQFATELAPFDVTVTTIDPGGLRERVHFGAVTGSTNLLGQSPVNFLNTSSSTASVYSANFGFILEPAAPRATQIDEISIALSGTGLHELGHSFGMRHHASYGDPRITPANYTDTQSIQNQHLIATGSTGLSEQQREMSRNYSQWSRVLMEAALNLTPTPLPLDVEFTDAGDTPATAMVLDTTPLSISQTEAAMVYGQLSEETDVDWFAFEVQNPMQLTAEIYSQGLFAFPDDFDSQLRLYSPDGMSILGANDNVLYDGDLFDASVMHESDSFLLNVLLPTAGTYFIEVSSNGPQSDPSGGGIYELIFAASEVVPEPVHSAVWLGMALWMVRRKKRKPT